MFRIPFRLLAFACASGAMFAASPELDRELVLAPHSGAASEDAEVRRWQERARRSDSNADVFARLGWAYVAKARRTLDAGFYKLAEKTADVIDARFGVSAESRLLRGHVLHNLHRFREAEAVARQLVAERALPVDWALLSDALIEQGKLPEGIAALQRLADLKPGVEAFSRIAHVRWLKGDLPGAIDATERALAATSDRDLETRVWLLVRLSAFQLQRGDAAFALTLADEAMGRMADYPPALFARGRALLALGKSSVAVESLQRAEELQPLPEYQWWLADALRAVNRDRDADAVTERLKARGAQQDARTLALFLATRGERAERALRLARAELAEREDVFSHDALAWAMFGRGDTEGASVAMRRALSEGTKDARLLWHAGEIALARGERDAAAAYFAQAHAAAGTLTPSERVRLAGRATAADGLAAR